MRLFMPFVGSLIVVGAVVAPLAASAAASRSQVFVVGALHALHEREPDFSYEQLGRVIEAVKPDVLLLEVRPDELAEKKETQGRPEYPQVVWPLLAARDYQALPLEPGDPLFSEMVSQASGAAERFAKAKPDASARLDAYRKAQTAALLELWRSPADVHGELTANLTRAAQHVQHSLVGPEEEAVQTRWDGYMADRALEAVRANPGKRILVLGSYRNRAVFVERLREAGDADVVDMATWLRTNGFDGAPR